MEYTDYTDKYNYENFPSETEENEENDFLEQVQNEEHYDKYCDLLHETFNNMKDYINQNCKNKYLLDNCIDYLELDQLFKNNKYDFPEILTNSNNENENKKDIFIHGPVDLDSDLDNKKYNFISTHRVIKNRTTGRRKKAIQKKIHEKTKQLLSKYNL